MTDEERVADLDRIADRAASEAESLRWLLADWRRLKSELDNSEPIGQHCACRYDGERLLQECVPHAAMRRDAARWRWCERASASELSWAQEDNEECGSFAAAVDFEIGRDAAKEQADGKA